jgi:hypothetical protein
MIYAIELAHGLRRFDGWKSFTTLLFLGWGQSVYSDGLCPINPNVNGSRKAEARKVVASAC